jgi:hypothetical protein
MFRIRSSSWRSDESNRGSLATQRRQHSCRQDGGDQFAVSHFGTRLIAHESANAYGMRYRDRVRHEPRGRRSKMIKSLVVIGALAASVSADAQTFSQRAIDTSILPDLMPGRNFAWSPVPYRHMPAIPLLRSSNQSGRLQQEIEPSYQQQMFYNSARRIIFEMWSVEWPR